MRPRFTRSFRRLSQLSLQNLGRNLLLATATTMMMGLILFIFNVIMVLNALTQSSLDKLGEKVDLIVYLSDRASLSEISEMQEDLKTVPVVETVEYKSKEEALQEFLSLYPEKSDPFTLYELENPLPGSLRIVTVEPDQHQMVIDYLKESAFGELLLDIESSSENQEIVDRLLKVTAFTKKLLVGVVITFLLGSLLMVMNAIHLSIFTRRTEIEIMQLVGANPSMIHGPFLFEGAFYSLFAVLFSFLLLLFFLEGTRLSEFTSFEESFNPGLLFGIELLVSIAVGVLSSYAASTYYLKHTLALDHA